MNQLNLAQRAKRTLLSLVAASLLLQGLFPSGYMPGSLASGWVAMLCPEGLPPAFVQQLNERIQANNDHGDHGHHQHHHHHSGVLDQSDDFSQPSQPSHSSHSGDAGGACQLGSALDQPFDLAQVISISAAPQSAPDRSFPPTLQVVGALFLAPSPRGPPIA